MIFSTAVNIPHSNGIEITPSSNIFSIGSCFAEEIAERLSKRLINTLGNPYGTAYNPLSIEFQLRRIINSHDAVELYTIENGGKFHSLMAHSCLSAESKAQLMENINTATRQAHTHLCESDVLLVTFGTAYVYYYKGIEDGEPYIVANCHKLRDNLFHRRLLTVDEIIGKYRILIKELREFNPKLKIIATVSPIRHIKDGLHGNNISKATLLLALNALEKEGLLEYFPSYEIVTDELRDYRFYADDMVHPSAKAADYIFERFGETYCSAQTVQFMAKAVKITSERNHYEFKNELTKDIDERIKGKEMALRDSYARGEKVQKN